jgi:tetratricopeptide (TPR) repeat protein
MSKEAAIKKAKENHAKNLAAQAVIQLNGNNNAQAIELFKKVSDLPDEDIAKVNFNMAIAYERLAKFAEMNTALLEAERLEYSSQPIINLYFKAGTSLHSSGEYAEAEALFTSLSVNPNCPATFRIDVFARLAEAQKAQGNNVGYIESLKKAVAAYEADGAHTSPDLTFSAYKILGTSSLEDGDHNGAKGYFDKAMVIHDDDHALLNNLGLAELELAKVSHNKAEYDSAKAHIEQAFELNESPDYSANLTGVVEAALVDGIDI